MKKTIVIYLFLLLAILSCVEKKAHIINGEEPPASTGDIVVDEYLCIGGYWYDGYKVSELDKITSFTVLLHPYAEDASNSFEGIGLLKNVKDLGVMEPRVKSDPEGSLKMDISGIDFSPLNSLKNLKNLDFHYVSLNKMPDLSGISSLEWIWIYDCKIMSLDGIEKAGQVKQLNIYFDNNYFGGFTPLSGMKNLEWLAISGLNSTDSEGWEKTVFRVSDLYGLAKLKHLGIGYFGTIDLGGIEALQSLDTLDLHELELIKMINIQSLSMLKNLDRLEDLAVSPSVPSLDFLGSMTGLSYLEIYGNGNTIDVTPLRNLYNLEYVKLKNFTIENFHILDELPKLKEVGTYGSKFYPASNNKLKNAVVLYEYINDR